MKGKTYNQEYSIQQGFHSDLMEEIIDLQTSNSLKGSTPPSLTKNVKQTYLSEKEKAITRNMKITK